MACMQIFRTILVSLAQLASKVTAPFSTGFTGLSPYFPMILASLTEVLTGTPMPVPVRVKARRAAPSNHYKRDDRYVR